MTLARLPRAVALLPRALALGPHGRRRVVALLVLAALLGALYMFWLRDSSLVKVDQVTVSGLSPTPDSARVTAKLEAAARRMTTLHVDADALRSAVADEPSVRAISVQAHFPHRLDITVSENRPVALLVGPGRTVAVAGDGTVLSGGKQPTGVPELRVSVMPAGPRLSGGGTLDRVAVAGAAPPALLSHIASITLQRGRGAVAQLEHGPLVILGSPAELAQKWAAAAAVLAHHASAGATYIDVRIPSRPAAGGVGPQQDQSSQSQTAAAPAPSGATTPSQTGAPASSAGAPTPATGTPQAGATATSQSRP